MTAAVLKARKELQRNPESEPETLGNLQQQFLRTLPRSVPPGLGDELFAWAWPRTLDQNRNDLLGDLCDLFSMDYDEQADPLTPDDWAYISDIVSDFDQDLELSLLQYIMIRVVDHGALD